MNVPTDTWIRLTGEWVTSHPWYAVGFAAVFAAAVLLAFWPLSRAFLILREHYRGWRKRRSLRAVHGPRYAMLNQPARERCDLDRGERERLSVIAAKYELTEAPDPFPAHTSSDNSTVTAMRLIARAARRVRDLTTNTRGGNPA